METEKKTSRKHDESCSKSIFAKTCVKKVAEKLKINLKDKQMDAIVAFVSGNDVFVSLPTGYGKSLIYVLLPMVFDLYKGNVLLNSIALQYFYHRTKRQHCNLYKSINLFNAGPKIKVPTNGHNN